MKYNPDLHNRHSIRLQGYDYANAGAYFVTVCLNQRIPEWQRNTDNFDFPTFGTVENGVMVLNDTGKMVQQIWNEITQYGSNIKLGEFVAMPDHIHGIIEIYDYDVGATPRGCPIRNDVCHVGNNICHVGNNICHVGNNICHIGNNICHVGNNICHIGNNICHVANIAVPLQTPLHASRQMANITAGQPHLTAGQPRGVAPTIDLPYLIDRFKTGTTNKYIDGVKQKNWIHFNKKLWQRNYHEHIIRNEIEYAKIARYIKNNPILWEKDCFNFSMTNNRVLWQGVCPIAG
jgi:REP element-mobilizing transposase RayT